MYTLIPKYNITLHYTDHHGKQQHSWIYIILMHFNIAQPFTCGYHLPHSCDRHHTHTLVTSVNSWEECNSHSRMTHIYYSALNGNYIYIYCHKTIPHWHHLSHASNPLFFPILNSKKLIQKVKSRNYFAKTFALILKCIWWRLYPVRKHANSFIFNNMPWGNTTCIPHYSKQDRWNCQNIIFY
jgi:hypothetical protein